MKAVMRSTTFGIRWCHSLYCHIIVQSWEVSGASLKLPYHYTSNFCAIKTYLVLQENYNWRFALVLGAWVCSYNYTLIHYTQWYITTQQPQTQVLQPSSLVQYITSAAQCKTVGSNPTDFTLHMQSSGVAFLLVVRFAQQYWQPILWLVRNGTSMLCYDKCTHSSLACCMQLATYGSVQAGCIHLGTVATVTACRYGHNYM